MKELLHISKKNQLATIVLGLIIAMFSVVAPYYYFVSPVEAQIVEQVNDHEDQAEKGESSQESPVKETIVKALDAVPNVLQISFPSVVATGFLDISFDSIEYLIENGHEVVKSSSKYFKTLFRNIISPNAP